LVETPDSGCVGETRSRIASFGELWGYLKEDYAVHRRQPFRPGFHALAVYRIGVWCDAIQPRLLRIPVRLFERVMHVFVRNFYGIELYTSTRIGRRFYIAHQNGIVIHREAVIGDDCVVRQGVTIGTLTHEGASRVPVVGNRVQFGVGSIAAGAITIGDDVTIGPNAVLLTSVPASSIVASPQCRILARPPRRVPVARLEGTARAENAG
jgi:serine O-acetyltransferase